MPLAPSPFKPGYSRRSNHREIGSVSRCWTLVNDGPRHAEPVAQHAEAGRVKRLLHWHVDLTAVRKEGVDSFRLFIRVHGKVEIDAPHLLKDGAGNIIGDEDCISNVHPRMNDRLARPTRGARSLVLLHHCGDAAAEMFFVEPQCCLTVAAKVELRVKLHVRLARS